MFSSAAKPLLGVKHSSWEKSKDPNAYQHRDTTVVGQMEDMRVDKLIAAAMAGPPPKVVECLRVCKPAIDMFIVFLRIAAPFVIIACKTLYQIYKVTPTDQLKMIYGLGLCFFGGEFCASIAAVEVFRRTGGDKLLICLQDVGANIQVALEASQKDDQIMQAQQVSGQDWYKHKVGVVMKAVNPDVMAQAFSGLYKGFIGVVMTLKFKFAYTVALAVSIADMLRKPTALVITPVMVHLLPKEYHKWINQMINCLLKFIAVQLAWKLEMVVSAFQSGLLGASLVGHGIMVMYLTKCKNEKDADPAESTIDQAIGLPLAVLGVWFQLSHGFTLPFPMNILFMPLTIFEEGLRMCITFFPVMDGPPGGA